MNQIMTKCCVIGGAGFIGSHLVVDLQKSGRSVTVVGRREVPIRRLPDSVKYISGDYSDTYFLEQILGDHDEVILLAYTTVPKTSYDDPVKDLLTNVPYEVAFFELASKLALKKIVFVSSGGTIYGKPVFLPISEDHPTNPISPYGITKLTIEKYAFMYHVSKGLPVVCVRPGNAYGEGQRPFTGQGFIATAINSILQNKEILLFGDEGTVRDYIHVHDIVSGIMAVLTGGLSGECYNVGTGRGSNNYEILQILSPLAEAQGFTIKCSVVPSRPFDVPKNILDSAKLRSHTGWRSVIGLEEGLQMTWNCFFDGRGRLEE